MDENIEGLEREYFECADLFFVSSGLFYFKKDICIHIYLRYV